jgi:hypothetical protein
VLLLDPLWTTFIGWSVISCELRQESVYQAGFCSSKQTGIDSLKYKNQVNIVNLLQVVEFNGVFESIDYVYRA